MIRHRPASPAIEVIARPGVPTLPDDLQREVDGAWGRARQAQLAGDELFDGLVFSLDRLDDDGTGQVVRLEGCFVPYSWYVAARENAAVSSVLSLSVMGVSGLLECPEGVVVGVRAATQLERGSLELVPSGTLDDSCARDGRVDVRAHVLKELREEVGIESGGVTAGPTPFTLVLDDASGVADLGVRMRTDLSVTAIRAIHDGLDSPEYESVTVLDAVALRKAILGARRVVPASLGLLEAAGLLSPSSRAGSGA